MSGSEGGCSSEDLIIILSYLLQFNSFTPVFVKIIGSILERCCEVVSADDWDPVQCVIEAVSTLKYSIPPHSVIMSGGVGVVVEWNDQVE